MYIAMGMEEIKILWKASFGTLILLGKIILYEKF